MLHTDFYHIFYVFLLYSFLGWLWEVVVVFLDTKKLVNRGFLNGPLCPIYGTGATILFLFLTPVKDHLLLLYVAGMLVATTVEYLVGMGMEKLFHASWWDYSDRKYNLNGKICVSVSLLWGGLSVVMMRWIQPHIDQFIDAIPLWFGKTFAVIFTLYFCSDLILTVYHVMKWDETMRKLEEAKAEFRQRLGESRLYAAAEEMKLRLDWDEKDYAKELRSRLEVLKEGGMAKEALEEAWEEFRKRRKAYGRLMKPNFTQRRLLQAFPKLHSVRDVELWNEWKEKSAQWKEAMQGWKETMEETIQEKTDDLAETMQVRADAWARRIQETKESTEDWKETLEEKKDALTKPWRTSSPQGEEEKGEEQ